MTDDKKQVARADKVKVFETQQVRTAWNADEEEWYFRNDQSVERALRQAVQGYQ